MDGIITEEDKRMKNNVYIQCRMCFEWCLLEGDDKTSGQLMKDIKCEFCGDNKFIRGTVISERTFNREIAMRKKSAQRRQMLN